MILVRVHVPTAVGTHVYREVRCSLELKKTGGAQLKNVGDPDEQQKLLRDSMSLSEEHDVSGKKILLIDDLYRSGSTLSVATELQIDQGGAGSVSVLTMTKTRSWRCGGNPEV